MSYREGNYVPCNECGAPAGKRCMPKCPALLAKDAALGARGETHDEVNHPAHYTSGEKCPGCGRVIECIDVIEKMTLCVGNAVKYCWRAGLKLDGDQISSRIKDLKKAVWYLTREITRLEKEKIPTRGVE